MESVQASRHSSVRARDACVWAVRPNNPSATDIECSKCGRPMMIRTAGTGVFLGCSGYILPPKERCKHTVNLTAGDEAVNIDEDDEAESKLLLH